jgi:hypothetical protein
VTAELPPHDPAESAPSPSQGASDARLARWMEQAGAHQTRAVSWLRRARDPASGPLPVTQRREMLMRALEHILNARRLLLRAQKEAEDAALLTALDTHLARLASTAESTERLLNELSAAEG